MKSSAANYFASLSPLKHDRSLESRGAGAQGGRCHCCPYGYHIDLDFVRYCHSLAKGSQQESATLRKLKQSKKQRRRETHSMEFMLGLLPQQLTNGVVKETSKPEAPAPPPRRNSLKLLQHHLSNQASPVNAVTPRIAQIVSSTVSSSVSKSATVQHVLPSPPPPDVVRMANGGTANKTLNWSETLKNASPDLKEAATALQEAVSDFEELLNNSQSHKAQMSSRLACLPRRQRSISNGGISDLPSLDLLPYDKEPTATTRLTSTPYRRPEMGSDRPVLNPTSTAVASMLAQSAVNRVRSNSVTRSNSLPRHSEGSVPHGWWGAQDPLSSESTSTRRLLATVHCHHLVHFPEEELADDVFDKDVPEESSHAAWFSRMRPQAGTTPSTGYSPYTAGQTGGMTLREALASLELARGGSSMRSPTPPPDMDVQSVASVASQVSTSTLQSIRDQMATGLLRLRELEAEVRCIPQLQRQVEELREERSQLHRALVEARSTARWPDDALEQQSRVRLRTQSPVRVNLEEFCSYRRARTGSISDCSDSESVKSDHRLRSSSLSAANRLLTSTRMQDSTAHTNNSLFITETSDSLIDSHTRSPKPTTDTIARRSRRDAATSCKVLTRDVGIHHAARVRSVGLMADLLEPKVSTAGLTAQREREVSFTRDLKRPTLPHLLSVSRSTQTVEDKVDTKTKLLSQLGRQNSAIIDRLSEVQSDPPRLTFDNSTNTEQTLVRSQGTITEQLCTRDQRLNTTLLSTDVWTKEEVETETKERLKAKLQDELDRAKKRWQFDSEETFRKRLREEMGKLEKKYQAEFETELSVQVSERVREELEHARGSVEHEIEEEIRTRVEEEVSSAKKFWESSRPVAPVPKPTRESAIQTDIPLSLPESLKIEKPLTRTVAAGDAKLTDILCENCLIPKKSIGCSWDKVTDVVCDSCKEQKLALSLKPLTKSCSVQTSVQQKRTTAISTQTLPTSCNTVSTNTTFLALKKEETILTTTSSPAGTPELERRPFGSSGVRICDKCNETITSVAKDFVGTSGSGSSLVPGDAIPVIIPLPPTSGSSKIPRLVDPFKLEPKLDTPDELGSAFNRNSELRRSDSKLHKSSVELVELRRRKDATPDLLSDSNIAKDLRRNSGSDADRVSKTPFNRQQTYTKILDGGELPVDKSSQKMLAFEEEVETKTKSRQNSLSSHISRNIYRRERSSPEIRIKSGLWNRPVEAETSDAKCVNDKEDTWQHEMMSFAKEEESDRASRSTSVESSATYKVERPLARSGSPSPTKSSPSPPRKATPVPEQAAVPTSFPHGGRGQASDGARPTAPSGDSAGSSVPSIVRTSPPPEQKYQASSLGPQESAADECNDVNSGDESVITQASSAVSGTRKKTKLSRSLRAALKVLNDSIGKPVRSGQQLTNALNIIQRDWFKATSQKDSDPHVAEDLLDVFEMQYSRNLLNRIVNLTDVNGNTAMHYAVSHNNFDVVSLLLDSKVCNVNQQNKAGYTASMLVSLATVKCAEHASVVERLFSLSDVNVKAAQHGQTALMLAVSHGRLDTVRMLLNAGADVNIQDDDGSTALMCAAEHGHLAIVRFLLKCPDVDAYLVDNDGSTALAIAVEAGHKDVGVLLYKHMNLAARGSSPYSSMRGGHRSRTPTMPRSSVHTPPPRFSAPPSPGRSRRGSGPPSPPSVVHGSSPHNSRRHKTSSASLSNLNF